MQIDWMLVTYLVVGFFALVGFFRGWWKEAITTFLLASLLILLQRPDWALVLINFINWVIATVWQFVANLFNLTSVGSPFQLDPVSSGTWILILILFLGLSIFIGRITLPSAASRPTRFYAVSLVGRILGLLLGALNGYLILSLIREYLDGRALPGGTPPETEIAVSGGSAFGPAANTLSIQAINLPSFTVLDSYLPWFIIGIGFLLLFAVLKNRIKVLRSKAGSKVAYVPPYGYQLMETGQGEPAVIQIPFPGPRS